ncbi:MAG TPA: anti-sigma factor [Burkholderiales bacterium]|nr:anti-sigma factor [Burkholderiales bacterium]
MTARKDPALRDLLAAEYVLGTLRGRGRARFRALARYDPQLRGLIAQWEARLVPLAQAAEPIAPPAHLRAALLARIAGAARGARWRESLALWRALAAAGSALALVLAVLLAAAPRPEPPMAMIAVMSDERGAPAMVVSWPPMKRVREPYLRIRVLQEHPVMAPGTAWELWMLPGGDAAPVSLGLIGTDAEQVLKVKPALAGMMEKAWGVAMSVEPAGGSPTGAPTGPVLFKGQCVKIL